MAHGLRITIPKLLRIKAGIIPKLGKYLASENMSSIVLLWGEGMEKILGDVVNSSLAHYQIRVLYSTEVTSIDIRHCFENCLKVPSDTKGIVAIGGGKALDHAKYLAHNLKIPLMSVPTIISNDGICSSLSSLIVEGKRRTVKTTIPHAVVVDLDLVSSAPKHFIYSGIGDLVCKGSAIADWKLAYHQRGEYVDDFAVMMAQNAFDAFLHFFPKKLDDPNFLKVIVSSLILIGVAMEIAGSSRPASGSEHLISHALDQISKKPHGHGIQVAVASIITSHLQGEGMDKIVSVLQETGFLDYVRANPLQRQELIDAIRLAPSIKSNFYTILSEEQQLAKALAFIGTEPLFKEILAE